MEFHYEGNDYKIEVSVPEMPFPEQGFPVLYVLDGEWNGVLVNEIVRTQMQMRKQTKLPRMIVVTIAQPVQQRFQDFTPFSETYAVSTQFPMSKEGPFGGAETFSTFIEEVLKPYVATHYPAGERTILLGHSLSGYFVMWQMITQPTHFTSYIAISPSVWWNDEALVHEDFSRLALHPPASLYVAAGEFEGSMIGPIERLLSKLPQTFSQRFDVVAEENHLSVFPSVLSKALRYVQAHKK